VTEETIGMWPGWVLSLGLSLLVASLAFAAGVVVVVLTRSSSSPNPFPEASAFQREILPQPEYPITLLPLPACGPQADGSGLEILDSATMGGYWAAVRGSWSNKAVGMTLAYGLTGSSSPAATVDLPLMRAPVERRTADDSTMHSRWPGVKPRLLRLSGVMTGGTAADPTIEVRVILCGIDVATAQRIRFYTASLGIFGSGELDVTAGLSQAEYGRPSGMVIGDFVSCIGVNHFGPSVSTDDGDTMLAGVAYYDGSGDLRMAMARSTDTGSPLTFANNA